MRTFDIVFVPGLRPKPPAEIYRQALLRCVEFGLQRHAPSVAADLHSAPDAFHLYAWTEDVYSEKRDIAVDEPGIGALLAAPRPDARQRAAIDSPWRRMLQTAHRVGDRFPLLGRVLASERQRILFREARDYLRDRRGIGERVRTGLRELLSEIHTPGRPLVVVGHSLGSVIAYDTLWELSAAGVELRVSHFVTIGSPLGTYFVRQFLKGADEPPGRRYPRNIDHWTNIAAIGELTALFPRLREHFAGMLEAGALQSFEDFGEIYNHFYGPQGLNVHCEYGYVIQPEFASALAAGVGRTAGT